MKPEQIIELLKEPNLRVFDKNNVEYMVKHSSGYNTIYFWAGGFYDRFATEIEEDYKNLIQWVPNLQRIEKEMDSEYLPIWTKVDGIIDINEKFVRLNGRYYTINYLEKLLDKIKDFKNIEL